MIMGNVTPIMPQPNMNNVIELTLVDGKLSKKKKVRYNKDGSIDKRHTNRVAGVSSEVYALTSDEEIKAMIDVFDERIDKANGKVKKQIACRNKMLFLIGINIGLRASDLCSLKYSFFFTEKEVESENGEKKKVLEWKDFYTLQPKKTRKTGKFVKLYFNMTVKKAITDYITDYPVDNVDDYLFKSRNGNKAISEPMLWKIMNDASIDAEIKRNIGSHSLRKTWGFWAFHNAEDKSKALVTLQMIFNHSDQRTTMKYIGLLNNEIEDMFYSIDLGLDYL